MSLIHGRSIQSRGASPEGAPLHLKIARALGMAAVAVQLYCIAGTFARRATVLATRLRGTRAGRVFTFFFIVVSHETPPETLLRIAGR